MNHPADTVTARLLAVCATLFGLVPLLAFVLAQVAGVSVNAALLLAAALFVLMLAMVGTRRLPSFRPLAIWPLIAAVAVGLLYAARHGGPMSPFTCVGEAAHIAAGLAPSQDLLRSNVGDSRLGNVAVMAGWMVFSRDPRLLHAALGVLLALSGFVIGRSCSTARWSGWLGLVALGLNPWLLAIPRVEESLFATSFSAALIALCLVPRPSWSLVGALFGLVFSMRHPLVLVAPGLLWLAWRGGGARAVLQVALWGLATSAVAHVHHVLAFGSVFSFESNAQFPPQAYRLFGLDFSVRAFMGWPFTEPLRTPNNPFPMLIAWPLHALDHLGLLLWSFAVVGAVRVWFVRRSAAVMLWLWWLPVYLAVGVQEAWDHSNKMGVLAMLLPVAVAFAVVGLDALTLGRRLAIRAGALTGAVLLLTVATVHALSGVHVPADQRYFKTYTLPPIESAAWLAHSREQALDIGLLPDWSRVHGFGPLLHGDKLTMADYRVPWGWPETELPGAVSPVTLQFSLAEPALRVGPVVRVIDGPPTFDLTRGDIYKASAPVNWGTGRASVTVARGRRAAFVLVSHADFAAHETSCPEAVLRPYQLTMAAPDCHRPPLSVLKLGASSFSVRVDQGAISWIRVVNPIGHVAQLWRVDARDPAAAARGPVLYWHD